MSLQFIFGGSGSGKSHYLYENIVRQSVEEPEKNYLVLVPEQFTMQTQKDLCLAHPCGGIMNIDVLSFARLAHRVFEEVGRDNRMILDDEGKNLVLRKIAGNYEEELTVLKGNLKKQGYISEVKSVISEFTQYGVDFDRLDEFVESLDSGSYLYYKLKDISRIYQGFEEYLQDRYITKEEMLDVLSDTVPESEFLKGSVVALDGFTGFTPVQDRLLGELLRVCDKVMITVEMDENEDPFVYSSPYQLFALSKKMVTSLVKIANEEGVETEDPVFLYGRPVRRFAGNRAMAFLEAELFRYTGKKYTEPQDALSLHEARNPRAEARYAAEGIRYLVREKGYRYREIAVITSDMELYADALEKACADFQIPVFMDHKKSILLNSFVEYIRSLLDMVEQNFSYDSVFRYLRTGLCGFTAEETDRLENYCLAAGIKGYRNWQQAWVRPTREETDEKLGELNHLRVLFVEKLQDLLFVLRQRKKTVRDITLALYTFFSSENMQEKLAEMEQDFQQRGELALAKEYAQIYRIVIELFDKFAGLLGDEKISLREYAELLDAGLEEAKVGVIPPSLDQVVIGDVERTRIKNIRALFFLGANDTLLPGSLLSGGLLSERDREAFEKEDIPLSPGSREKVYIQKFYLYTILTKPSEYLFVSWSRISGTGESRRPAYLITDLKRMFTNLTAADEENRSAEEKEISRNTGLRLLAEGLRDRQQGLDERWKELYGWFARDPESRQTVDRILSAGFLKREYPRLEAEKACQLYPDISRVSVTRLERFSACAYAHFLSYGLRLSDREEYGFEPLDLGNIAHQSLERFARKMEEKNQLWNDLLDEERDSLINTCVDESVLDYGNTVLFSSARNESMIGRIKRLMRRSVWALVKQLEKGDFVPAGYELKFGSGKIDRVDTCEDEEGVYVKVTDYKTGLKNFDITAFYHGLQLQLPVYLNAALDVEGKKYKGKKMIPAGIFYYRIQDPLVERQESDEEVKTSILRELKLDGLLNGDGKVLDHLEHQLSGNSVLFPVGVKKDGSLTGYSHALPGETFQAVLDYARKKEKEIKSEMFSGEVTAAPYKMGSETGCDYCAYREICGFDLRIDGCRYRELKKYGTEEAVAKMLAEVKDNGRKMDE